MTELEKYQAVNACETAGELEKAILSIAEDGQVPGRSSPKNAETQASYVKLVLTGYPANILTRSYGIRQQALYIKYYENL
jgi:hypothetical protein